MQFKNSFNVHVEHGHCVFIYRNESHLLEEKALLHVFIHPQHAPQQKQQLNQ